jgi:serine/threonine protein kinase
VTQPTNLDVAIGDRFRIVRRIGAGGMGVVYEADDTQVGSRVALKTLREMSGQALYRLKQEFRSLADMHHPNLVRLGDLFCSKGVWFFTMELIEGDNLLEHVRRSDASIDDSL